MENQFLIDSEYLSKEALEKKHRLETDPSSRKNHMEYMEGMESERAGRSPVGKGTSACIQCSESEWRITGRSRMSGN